MSTILVVDDDEYMRDLLRLHLSNAGYDDVEMPFMSGLEFVKALKADPAVSDIPVVAFLRKPLLASHLLATVAGYVEGGRIAL
jgi:CheY-like chemotaxis protein